MAAALLLVVLLRYLNRPYSLALLNLENIAVLAISKEVVQGIGHGSPQVIIRLEIISKITGSEVTPFAVITDESTGVKHPLAD